jgi:hypothetical protein
MPFPGTLRHMVYGVTSQKTAFFKLVFLRSLLKSLVTGNVVPSSPIIFRPDDEKRNVGSHKSHTVLHPRRRHSS